MRAVDWSRTALGPAETWPMSLRLCVRMLLHSRQPMFLWWGPELIQFFNDAYLPSFDVGKLPAAMGQRGADCWQEIWPIIWPQIDDVMARAKASWNEDQLVPILRNGRVEEAYWTYGYSPVFDEADAVAGTLVVCTETTARVLAARRVQTLSTLISRTAVSNDSGELARAVAEVLEGAANDVPFAALVRAGSASGDAGLAAAVRLSVEGWRAIEPTVRAAASRPAGGRVSLPEAPGLAPGAEAFVAPVDGSTFLVFGLSARLPFDDGYREHLARLAEHVAMAEVHIAELVRARRVLEQSHAEREERLSGLETAARAKDEFLAMLAHELRNPLAPIVTALHLMKLRGDGRITNEQEILSRQVAHLVRLVDDLLDISRITGRTLELRPETLEIATVAAEAVEIAGVLIEQREHHLTVDVPPSGLRCVGDPVRLVQVFANLLTNAARYTEPGGHIRLAAAREGEEIVVSVTDDGIGMAPEVLPHVFDVFFQGRRSAEGGLGLGLALVKSLVTMNGGSVLATSRGLGKGSELVVRLPAAAADASPALEVGPRSSRVAPVAVARRVLVVDDNVDAANLLADVLGEAGHVVTIAYDPVDALEVATSFAPEIAILDIGLPIMDGYELGARLRALAATRACRLIALTGYAQEHDRARSAQAGFDIHLVKPLDFERLTRIVSEVAPAQGTRR